MNKDTEKKLDELLSQMPKRDYDLDAWLEEDETAEFERIVSQRPRTDTVFYSPRTHTDLTGQDYKRRRTSWHWVAAAACLLIIIGVGVTIKLTKKDNTQLSMVQPQLAQTQPFPSHQGEGVGVGSVASKPLALEDEEKLQTPPRPTGTPPLLETLREQAPASGRAEGQGVAARTHHSSTITHHSPPTSHHSSLQEDTLGSSIWQREENVVRAVQILNDCEQTIRREEQELRNDIIRATFNATPQPAKAQLLLNDGGDLMVVEDNGPVIIAL